MIYMFLSNNPSSGDINSSNLSCCSMHFCLMFMYVGIVLGYSSSGVYLETFPVVFSYFPYLKGML